MQGIDTVFRNAAINVDAVHEREENNLCTAAPPLKKENRRGGCTQAREEKGTSLLGPRSGSLAGYIPNIGRLQGNMVLWIVIEVINTVAPEGRITIVDIHRSESRSGK